MAGNDDSGTVAQHAADSLALALEDVGFDVGQAFPALQGAGNGSVEIGPVQARVATLLASVLARAARGGITL